MYDRLGAAEPQDVIFAPESDLVPMNHSGGAVNPSDLHAGNVRLRDDKPVGDIDTLSRVREIFVSQTPPARDDEKSKI